MKGEYMTKARGWIVEYLKNHAEKRFTAREIYEAIKNDIDGVNRTTVYRNLDHLCEQGKLVKYKEPNQESWYYQYSSEHSHCNDHMHAQCSECGKIFHLDNEFVEEFEKKMQSVYGLDMNPSRSMIVGKCEECSVKKEK